MRSTLTITFLLTLAAAALFAGVVTDAQLQQERQQYLAALQADSTDHVAAWNLARILIDIGNRQQDKKQRKALYEEAVHYARQAVRHGPDDTWSHHYLAAAVGKLALTVGGKRKIELSKEVRDEAQEALRLDPDNDKSHHILGRWNREVAHLSPFLKIAAKIVYGGVPKGASDENAVHHFQEAIRINPRHINHHLELGKTWMAMRRYEKAIAEFQTCLDLPDSDPNDELYKAEARKLMTHCEKKIARRARKRQH